MKTLVFIPAYRCETQIKRVIRQFSPSIQEKIDTVIVVDNISPDNTLKSAIDEAKQVFTISNFIAWKNDNNYGLGGSHKAAIRYAVDNNFDYIIVLHGDDQADIADIEAYLTSESL
jgi:glycosyltransferase involved in cell wall biosynthesis